MANLVETTTGRSVAQVVDALLAALARRGIHVFAVIDHAAAARNAGLELPDETVVIFGDPGVGTALMLADARVGIDLPLRILAWSDSRGTHVAYRDIRDLTETFDVTSAQETIGRLGGLLPQLVTEMTTGD
ncbi:uncharacterized protein (DUF302 family) [Agromyces sp. 3263]|uniref:DUF302 domain-containing protein n=1 Tax=Agromyces sp. 3263 TaxID=2817750 RepID=UPI00286743CC|nr:DUF302 domain-containing protein [Agromyces sp. 3263]MDR6906950.1 uncharacterized protein (DUF302 family) [Agromyces sp. 3263]